MNNGTLAILLSGGLGTRLRDLFPDIPKALVPVAGKPIIHRQVEWLLSLGVDHVHVAAGHKAASIRHWLDATPKLRNSVTVGIEPRPLGTGGGIRFAFESLPEREHYLVLNGDSLLPSFHLTPLQKAMTPPCDISIAVTEIPDASRYGTVSDDRDGLVTGFCEKTGKKEPGMVNAGIYLFTRTAIQSIPEDTVCSLEKDIFPTLAATRKMRCVIYDPPLLDMGTPDGLEAMSSFLLNR